MTNIRHVSMNNKSFWYTLDAELCNIEFERKLRDKQGYLDRGSLFLDATPHEQPQELFMLKVITRKI